MKYPEHKHYSPDGLTGDDGMIEIKTVIPSRFVEIKATGKIETAYRKQMQYNQDPGSYGLQLILMMPAGSAF